MSTVQRLVHSLEIDIRKTRRCKLNLFQVRISKDNKLRMLMYVFICDRPDASVGISIFSALGTKISKTIPLVISEIKAYNSRPTDIPESNAFPGL